MPSYLKHMIISFAAMFIGLVLYGFNLREAFGIIVVVFAAINLYLVVQSIVRHA